MRVHDYDPKNGGLCRGCARTPGEVRALEKRGTLTVNVCPERAPRRPPARTVGQWDDLTGAGWRLPEDGWEFTITRVEGVPGDEASGNRGVLWVWFEAVVHGTHFAWAVSVPVGLARTEFVLRLIRERVVGVAAAATIFTPAEIAALVQRQRPPAPSSDDDEPTPSSTTRTSTPPGSSRSTPARPSSSGTCSGAGWPPKRRSPRRRSCRSSRPRRVALA